MLTTPRIIRTPAWLTAADVADKIGISRPSFRKHRPWYLAHGLPAPVAHPHRELWCARQVQDWIDDLLAAKAAGTVPSRRGTSASTTMAVRAAALANRRA